MSVAIRSDQDPARLPGQVRLAVQRLNPDLAVADIKMMDQIADETQDKWFDKLALNEAIGSLSERERLIVYLRYFRDQTQSEVASRLGISQVQVSRLEKKILQSIKDQIAQ